MNSKELRYLDDNNSIVAHETPGVELTLAQKQKVKAIRIEGYWVTYGRANAASASGSTLLTDFVLTPSVRLNLQSVSRVLCGSPHTPILLEGPTSAGKTSLVKFLAEATGNTCVRINNHEHTDLSEYVGQYQFVGSKLVFKDGPLTQAMRHGWWVILDELNLAPSEVLEARNRVLDANKELYIPETNETVGAHANFRLFATQNPAGSVYGGRKALSTALRNR